MNPTPFESFPAVFDFLRKAAGAEGRVFLVGGAVRDALLGRSSHDLDFVVQGLDAIALGRKTANALGAAFYILDAERGIARVLWKQPGEPHPLVMDFSALRAADLHGDLQARDFTLNAIALDVLNPSRTIDPLSGAADLHARLLRACSPQTFQQDPVRILRAVRLSISFQLRMDPAVLKPMRAAVPLLKEASIERQRDELFKILGGQRPASGLRILDQLGVLDDLLPEMAALKGVEQSAPHIFDVWEHTLKVVSGLDSLWAVLVESQPTRQADNLKFGLTVLHLGRFRSRLQEHFSASLNPGRSLRSLLMFAALYHDTGKPATRQVGSDGRVHFYEHDHLSGSIAAQRARALALSQEEVKHIEVLAGEHMRIPFLTRRDVPLTPRSIFRFFRAVGGAGMDLCLLSLADELAKNDQMEDQERWVHKLEICQALMEAWWEKTPQVVSPPRLLSGDDLRREFGLSQGPRVGQVLEALQEAQAAGEVSGVEQARLFVQGWLETHL